MYSYSRTISTLLGLNACRLRSSKHLLVTAFFIATLLTPNIRCSPTPTCNNILVRDQPFSAYVSNPCMGGDYSFVSNFTEEEKLAYRSQLFNNTATDGENLPSVITIYQRSAGELLKNMNAACRETELPGTSVNLQEKQGMEALLHIYYLLLKHLSEVHHIREQDIKYDSTCSGHRPNPSPFREGSKKLSSGLQEITCLLQVAISTYSVEESTFANLSESVLNSELCDSIFCSQRIMNDCRVLKSASSLLNAFYRYLQQM